MVALAGRAKSGPTKSISSATTGPTGLDSNATRDEHDALDVRSPCTAKCDVIIAATFIEMPAPDAENVSDGGGAWAFGEADRSDRAESVNSGSAGQLDWRVSKSGAP